MLPFYPSISPAADDIDQRSSLDAVLMPHASIDWSGDIPACLFAITPAIQANQAYYDQPHWAKTYFDACHRDEAFRSRWQAATGSWDNKVVVDIGCGPGNLYATLGGKPKFLLGVDVAAESLRMAQSIGYTPLLADAHQLPLVSGFADIVAVNATLHHCENMVQVLSEAARLVRPGGILVVDHDPQLSAWDYRGIALAFYKIRLPIYRLFLRRLHVNSTERLAALATEIHHKPGYGVSKDLFHQVLQSSEFEVKLYPHNQAIGAEVFQGVWGDPPHWRYQLGQRLSGINPNSPEAALSLLCIATRKPAI